MTRIRERSTSARSFSVARLAFALFFLVVGGVLLLTGSNSSAQAQSDSTVVRVITLDREVDTVSARYLSRAISNANSDNVELIVIELNTPGGTLDSTRGIVNSILESRRPVVVFVSPDGAQAASAGTFIAASGGLLAMAPATNIGAATPVDSRGNDLPSTLKNKITQDASAFMRSIADQRGRNSDALALTVTEARAYSSTEAVNLGVADLKASDLDDLLSQIDGRVIPAFGGDVTVSTARARVERVNMQVLDRALSFLANPNVAFLLIVIGTIGLIIELWTPGIWIPGFVGLTFLGLGFIGVGHLDYSWAGIVLIGLAIVLFVLEAQAPGVSYFGITGAIALVLGGFFLVGRFSNGDLPGGIQVVSYWLLGILGAGLAGFIAWLAWQIRKTKAIPEWKSAGSSSQLVGLEADVTTDLDPEGEVHV
ncbi:MAG: nodulation protein NfeD, partial [Chloroflexi bacterium]|nr:nodulation protein NfeD [Chloroflexota bacterium]